MTRRNPATDLALVAVFTALIAAVTVWVPGFDIVGSSVPITLQTLVIGLAGMVLGPVRGFLATLLYLVLGFAGLPVFAKGASGLAVLRGGSAGYLISFPIYAAVVGLFAYAFLRRGRMANPARIAIALVIAGLIGSALVVHPLGILGMDRNIANVDFGKAVAIDRLYWPGDAIKTVVAALVATAVHKAFPWLALGRRAVGRPAEAAPAL